MAEEPKAKGSLLKKIRNILALCLLIGGGYFLYTFFSGGAPSFPLGEAFNMLPVNGQKNGDNKAEGTENKTEENPDSIFSPQSSPSPAEDPRAMEMEKDAPVDSSQIPPANNFSLQEALGQQAAPTGETSAAAAAGPSSLGAPAGADTGSGMRILLEPKSIASLSARMGGTIETLNFKIGDTVKKDDVLISFMCDDIRAGWRIARAQREEASVTLTANRELAKHSAIGRLALRKSEIALDQKQAELAREQAHLNLCTLKAPFSGVISQVSVRPFDTVNNGTKMIEIYDPSEFIIRLLLPSSWRAAIKKDMPFKIHIDETGKVYTAHIIRIGSKIDPLSHTFEVEGSIRQMGDLAFGMSGRAVFDQNMNN